MSKQMTPCEKLGYKVGDKFKSLSDCVGFKVGSIITLVLDDGSELPLFKGVGGINDEANMHLSLVDKVKLKPAKQALADAIHQNGGWAEGGDWHKSGELPPVGEVCLYVVSERLSAEVEITAHARFGLCFVEVGKSGERYVSKTAELHRFIPIRSERERAIDEMMTIASTEWGSLEDVCGVLYMAGYRKEVK